MTFSMNVGGELALPTPVFLAIIDSVNFGLASGSWRNFTAGSDGAVGR
jgi:hypothetical protein